MKKIYLSLPVIFFCYAFLSSCGTVSREYRSTQNEVDSVMQQMIWTLEGGHVTEFVSTYLNPEFIERKGGVNSVLIEFNLDKRTALLKALKIAGEIDPFFNIGKMEVTFSDQRFPRDLTLKKIAGKWYLLDGYNLN